MKFSDRSLFVGFYLALRDIKRSNPGTTALIIFVMTLTFFNMNLIGGVLIGIAHGVMGSYKQYYSGNILVIPSTNNSDIRKTDSILEVIKGMPSYKSLSVRYTAPALIEYGYQTKLRETDISESAEALLTGINPEDEDGVTRLSQTIVAGSYLERGDADEILVGSSLIKKYSSLRGAANNIGQRLLKNADVGSKVRITVNGVSREVMIKGIVTTDGTNIDNRIFMLTDPARHLIGNSDLNANEISVLLKPQASEEEAKKYITAGIDNPDDVLVETSQDALPGGIIDVTKTFTILGNIVGGIALIVGAITIFIVIFVNAVTRRKYIGILKGIGISARAIEFSYIFQALFYAVSGIVLASVLAMHLLVPYFDAHPITYPIAKGSLAITNHDLAIRGIVLTITSFISGYVPAWLVTRQNTLDAILGR